MTLRLPGRFVAGKFGRNSFDILRASMDYISIMSNQSFLGKQPPRPLTFHPENNTCSVPLTKGFEAVIDASDYEAVAPHRWYAKRSKHTVYVGRVKMVGGKKCNVLMHRELVCAPGMDVDHRDGNGLNNRRANLRVATRTQNLYNQGTARKSNTGLRGAYRHKCGNYISLISLDKKQVYLGMFKTAQEAHEAYLAAAKKRSVEFIYRPAHPAEAL